MTSGNEVDRLLAPEEVARILAVPVKTLYDWRYKRIGPPTMKVGRHIRYRRSALEEWMALRESA